MLIKIGNLKNLLFLSCFMCCVLFLHPSSVLAENISFEATVNANKISLQDVVELTLTVHGGKGDVPAIPMPAINGFETRFVGPSTKLFIVNGVSSSEHSFIYNLFPSKVGHFQIPPISLMLDGHTYVTSPIDIDVVARSSSASSGTETDQEQSIEDKVFMKAFIGPKEVYVGQKTPLVMKVYVKDLSLQLAAAPYMTPDGFTADATASMQRAKEVVNGVNFDVLRFDANIYPTRPGELTVGPFQATGDLIYHIRQRDNDFFSDLFATEQTRPITLHAPAVSIQVLPLPSLGQPRNFSGAVGQYAFKASIGPSSVKVGDPLTLHMAITGTGRFKDLTMPTFNDNRFKTYDPQIKENEDSKALEQVIIPTNQNITEVPAISFCYFDPQTKEYKTITQGPFSIKVLPPAAGDEFKAYGFIDKTKPASNKIFVVRFDWVERSAQGLLARLKITFRDWRFWASVCAIFGLWFGWRTWQGFQKRLHNDEAFARRWQADSKARGLLKATKVHLQQNNSKEFYSSLYKTLNDYLADKMHVPLASLSGSMIEVYLKKRSIDPSKLEALKGLFERCDLVRFASSSVPLDQMQRDFEQLRILIHYLPKVLK